METTMEMYSDVNVKKKIDKLKKIYPNSIITFCKNEKSFRVKKIIK